MLVFGGRILAGVNRDGPHLQTAVFCERVLQEQDGVVSAIRMVDRIGFVTNDDGEPIQRQHPLTLLVMFKSGSARGTFTLSVRREKPSGEQDGVLEAPVFFEGEERGVNLILSLNFEPDQQGLYWFDVLFEGERATRIPLRAIFQRLPTAGRGE